MSVSTSRTSAFRVAVITAAAALAIPFFATASASAAIIDDAPVDLGAAESYGVLGASEVTNTGLTTVIGDVGVYDGTAITGFGGLEDGEVIGEIHPGDSDASLAQDALTQAMVDAAALTPEETELADLSGKTLDPGVYSGGALLITAGESLILEGDARSSWVFQASSSLTMQDGSAIELIGGASACNVFWLIDSSATLNTDVDFVGTIMAGESISALTRASVSGRLLASNGAVTLDTNDIMAPSGCGTEVADVEFTSAAPSGGTVDAPYTHTFTATGEPAPVYAVTTGVLPAGLILDATSGAVTGTPTTEGSYTFTVTASNGVVDDDSETYTVVVAAAVDDGGEEGDGGDGGGNPGTNPGTTPGEAPVVTPVETVLTPVNSETATMLAETGADTSGGLIAAALLGLGTLLLIVRSRSLIQARRTRA